MLVLRRAFRIRQYLDNILFCDHVIIYHKSSFALKIADNYFVIFI
ncbi:hypothetical protein CIT292_07503 [Citrobacter youngae ATCC 29220]|uniref:Uncharacterized protein n=1 Tax=Citrobacter youngae ATCC 29220 TaxID=500640 RepID=D4BAK9_9ENTR|nr:hypothetical protein CIT292_07503 [Citrobacter youngae ATCC 29220]